MTKVIVEEFALQMTSNFIVNFCPVIKKMTSEFVFTYCQLGEKLKKKTM